MAENSHESFFPLVEAYVIMGISRFDRVATIAFKLPKENDGRLHAHVHWLGELPLRGAAGGMGLDKRWLACLNAVRDTVMGLGEFTSDRARFYLALHTGPSWRAALEAAGFTVYQAV